MSDRIPSYSSYATDIPLDVLHVLPFAFVTRAPNDLTLQTSKL